MQYRAGPSNSATNQNVTKVVKKRKINWKRLTTEQKSYYNSIFMSKLDELAFANLCTVKNCKSISHHHDISVYCDNLIMLFKETDETMIQSLQNRNGCQSSSNRKWEHIPGWNDLLGDTYHHYKDAYRTWLET